LVLQRILPFYRVGLGRLGAGVTWGLAAAIGFLPPICAAAIIARFAAKLELGVVVIAAEVEELNPTGFATGFAARTRGLLAIGFTGGGSVPAGKVELDDEGCTLDIGRIGNEELGISAGIDGDGLLLDGTIPILFAQSEFPLLQIPARLSITSLSELGISSI